MKSFLQKIINLIFLFLLVFTPGFLNAVPTADTVSGKTGIVYECVNGDCTFNDLISAVKKVVNWGTIFALQFSVIVIAYAGFKYMKSGDNPGERKSANEMMRKVVLGIFFILLAWLIVTLFTNALLDPTIDTFLK